jgi:hypothetical protein
MGYIWARGYIKLLCQIPNHSSRVYILFNTVAKCQTLGTQSQSSLIARPSPQVWIATLP